MAAVMDDEMAQKVGLCIILNIPGDDLLTPAKAGKVIALSKQRNKVKNSVPCRYTSIRVCYNDPNMDFLLGHFRYHLGKFARLRQMAHYGTLKTEQMSVCVCVLDVCFVVTVCPFT